MSFFATGAAREGRGMGSIATLTMNPSVDRSCQVPEVLPEHKLRCETVRREPGGGGLNVSRVLHELGEPADSLWTCGGPTGNQLRHLLDTLQLDHRPIPITGQTRDNLAVFDQAHQQQYRFNMPGPDLADAEVDACLNACRELEPPPTHFVASGSLPAGAPADFYRRVGACLPDDTRLILDTAGPALLEGVEAGPHLIKVNLRELAHLAGQTLENDQHIDQVASDLLGRTGIRGVVVSLGAGGARSIAAEGVAHQAAPTVPVRSRVGAGDSMVAGVVAGLERNLNLAEAVRLGVAAGAAAVMTAGTELCRAADVDRLLKQTPAPQWIGC
jgi:6-phosphofructokinase 2